MKVRYDGSKLTLTQEEARPLELPPKQVRNYGPMRTVVRSPYADLYWNDPFCQATDPFGLRDPWDPCLGHPYWR